MNYDKPHAIERAELVVNELMGDYDDVGQQSIAHHLASYLLPGYVSVKVGGWSVVSPDGRCFTGNSAHHAANEANRAMRTPEQEAEMAANLAVLQSQHDADMQADYEHLNCPACGGSGHIDDAICIAAGVALTAAERDVLAERRRHVHVEGWTPEHDDKYQHNELSRAAACLATWAPEALSKLPNMVPHEWPWDDDWWKPCEPRKMLKKAASLIIAEMDRMDRAASREGSAPEGRASAGPSAEGMRPEDPWRQAVDAALVSAGLDCLAPDADPAGAIRRLLEWHETTVLDPAISERAQALIERGQASLTQDLNTCSNVTHGQEQRID